MNMVLPNTMLKSNIYIYIFIYYENQTELSKYVCGVKRKYIDFKLTWEVIKRAQPITNGNNPVCRLCNQQPLCMR